MFGVVNSFPYIFLYLLLVNSECTTHQFTCYKAKCLAVPLCLTSHFSIIDPTVSGETGNEDVSFAVLLFFNSTKFFFSPKFGEIKLYVTLKNLIMMLVLFLTCSTSVTPNDLYKVQRVE